MDASIRSEHDDTGLVVARRLDRRASFRKPVFAMDAPIKSEHDEEVGSPSHLPEAEGRFFRPPQ